MQDTPGNRERAWDKATEIQLDIKNDRFDYTLEKYQRRSTPRQPIGQLSKRKSKSPNLTREGLYEEYIYSQKYLVRPNTWISCYLYFLRQIKKSPVGDALISSDRESLHSIARSFYSWVNRSIPPESGKRLCQQVGAAFPWAISERVIKIKSPSPFEDLAKKIKESSKSASTKAYSEITPFSAEERDSSVEAFAQTANPRTMSQGKRISIFLTKNILC